MIIFVKYQVISHPKGQLFLLEENVLDYHNQG